MNTKNMVIRTVVTFAGLAVAGIGMAVSGRFMADALEQTVMVAIGSAMFGASLAFFLVRIFSLLDK
jgi:hypothetical protein